MGPPTRDIVGIGAPPPVDRPGVGGPGPQRPGSGAGVYLVIGLLLIAFVGGVAFFVTSGDDDESGASGQAAGTGDGTGSSTGGNDPGGIDPGGIDPTLPTTTAATTPTTPPPTPAQAAVNDCVQVTSAGDFVGTGSCTDGGTPYMVTEVLPLSGSCSNGNASYISSGDFLLCLQVNLNETYCYVLPEQGWITPASACQAPGTVHVIDIVPGATSDSACTTSYQWNRWYNIPYPQQIVCVMSY